MMVMKTVMFSGLLPVVIRLTVTNSSLSLTLVLTLSNPIHTAGDVVAI